MYRILVRRLGPALVFLLLGVGCGGRSTDDWIGQMQAKDSAQRLRAIKALSERTAEADEIIPVLIKSLKDEDSFVRRDAAQALGRFGTAAQIAVPALLSLARTRPAPDGKAALGALKQIDPAAAAKAEMGDDSPQ
jgi:HEAT repeat protein